MPGSLSLSRAWILLAMVAVIASAACATGAAPCSIGRPVGLGASLLAALLLVIVPDRPAEEPEVVESQLFEDR